MKGYDWGRSAKSTICRKCGTPVLTGPDHDIAAIVVTVDVTPVDPDTELVAVRSGIRSFTARSAKGGIQLWYRDTWHRTPSANPVHLEHRCTYKVEELPL
jgi:hypothetical protein